MDAGHGRIVHMLSIDLSDEARWVETATGWQLCLIMANSQSDLHLPLSANRH